jgi:hypothetical protein
LSGITLPPCFSSAVVALAVWIPLVELSTEAWYRMHEKQVADAPRWDVEWPAQKNRFQEIPVAEAARAMLRYNEGRSAAWFEQDGKRWQMFYFKWLPSRAVAQLAKGHAPDICLPATGRILKEPPVSRQLSVNGLDLRFRIYSFQENGRPLHVFYCLWEDRKSTRADESLIEDGSRQSRAAAVLAGRRNLGQRVIEIAAWGYQDEAEALAQLERQLRQLIRPG